MDAELLAGKDASFALLMLKALAFLELRRGNAPISVDILDKLLLLDPSDGAGASVVAALAGGPMKKLIYEMPNSLASRSDSLSWNEM